MNEIISKSGTIYINPDSIDKPDNGSGGNVISETETIKNTNSTRDGSHSFLFWLVVPFIIIWLTVGYFIGFIKEHPSWTKTGYATNTNKQISPYEKRYKPISKDVNSPYITIWFDDAWLSQYMVAYPLLKQHGYPAAVAVATNAIEKTNYMNWAQLRILEGDDWEITNHSNMHDCTMQNWSSSKITQDLTNASLLLWENKLTSDIFVTPCGVDSQTLRSVAKNEFIAYRTVNPGFNTISDLDSYQLKVKNTDINTSVDLIKSWIDQARQTNSWLILVFHKVGENSSGTSDDEYNISKNDFAEILNYINTNNIQVVVPSQIIIP